MTPLPQESGDHCSHCAELAAVRAERDELRAILARIEVAGHWPNTPVTPRPGR